MPIGTFLDTLPPALFIAAHVMFLLVGVWAMKTARQSKLKYASAFWLYIAVHVGFLAFFGGIFTLKMSVLLEQMLIVIMVIWIVTKSRESSAPKAPDQKPASM